MPETFEAYVRRELTAIRQDLSANTNKHDDYDQDIYGDPKRRITGALDRLDVLEKAVKAMEADRLAVNNKLKGIAIGLTMTGTGVGGLLIAVIRLVTGG